MHCSVIADGVRERKQNLNRALRALMVSELTSLSNIKIILILILRILRRCSGIWEWCLLLFFFVCFLKIYFTGGKVFLRNRQRAQK